jgi:hypothetical protein
LPNRPIRKKSAARRVDPESALSTGGESVLNLDDFADEAIEVPAQPGPALTLSDLRAVLDHTILLPRGLEAVPLNEEDYRFVDGKRAHAIRVTVDREFYELHADSVEFWTPGSPTFPDLDAYRNE